MPPRSVIGLLALAACAEPVQDAVAKKSGGAPALVSVAQARAGTMSDRWRFLGDVRAQSRADLAAGAAGRITRLLAREGDVVEKGGLIAEIDSALARARHNVAAAREAAGDEALAQARREKKRVAGLEKAVLAEVEIERATSKVTELEAQLTSLRALTAEAAAVLDLHRIRAPFDGVIASRKIDLGSWVKPGDPAVGIVSTEGVEIMVDASKDLVVHVARGDVVSLIAPGTSTTGKVAGVVPALDRVTRTTPIRIIPDDPTGLLPGSVISVEFSVNLEGRGVVVPQDALIPGPNETRVAKVVDNKAEHVRVEVLAKAHGDALVVADGIQVGTQVITRGNERVRPGQSIRIAE